MPRYTWAPDHLTTSDHLTWSSVHLVTPLASTPYPNEEGICYDYQAGRCIRWAGEGWLGQKAKVTEKILQTIFLHLMAPEMNP